MSSQINSPSISPTRGKEELIEGALLSEQSFLEIFFFITFHGAGLTFYGSVILRLECSIIKRACDITRGQPGLATLKQSGANKSRVTWLKKNQVN